MKNIEQILGCYFHQDWLDEFGGYDSAIRSIIESEPFDKIRSAIEEVGDLLASDLDEDRLRVILIDQLGCYFDPATDGMTCEFWLKKIRNEFAQALRSAPGSGK